MLVHHKDLKPERWYRFTLMEQLGNIGSDVIRAIDWKNKGRLEDSRFAIERALELIDLTVSDPKNRKRLREVLRTREALVDYFFCDNEYSTSDKIWEDYFNDFGYIAAMQRGR
ncbi:hypothetical protein K2X40_00710 [Candidatus Babeliales bacterium]|nr:hypothetical protein [Candidatus Babeliales bacterium]